MIGSFDLEKQDNHPDNQRLFTQAQWKACILVCMKKKKSLLECMPRSPEGCLTDLLEQWGGFPQNDSSLEDIALRSFELLFLV